MSANIAQTAQMMSQLQLGGGFAQLGAGFGNSNSIMVELLSLLKGEIQHPLGVWLQKRRD
jgi:hypothetical protein